MATGPYSCLPEGAFPFSFKVEVTPAAPLSAPEWRTHVWRDPGAVTHLYPYACDTAVTWAVRDSLSTICIGRGITPWALVCGPVSSLWAPDP